MPVTTRRGYYTSSSVPAPTSIDATDIRIKNMVNGNFEVFGRNRKGNREDTLDKIKFMDDNEFNEIEKYYEEKKNQPKMQKGKNLRNAKKKTMTKRELALINEINDQNDQIKNLQTLLNKENIAKEPYILALLEFWDSLVEKEATVDKLKNELLDFVNHAAKHMSCKTCKCGHATHFKELLKKSTFLNVKDLLSEDENRKRKQPEDRDKCENENNIKRKRRSNETNYRSKRKRSPQENQGDNPTKKTKRQNNDVWKGYGEVMLENARQLGINAKINKVTVGDGDCFYSSIIDQCTRPEIKAKLNDRMQKILNEEYPEENEDSNDKIKANILRKEIVAFIMASENEESVQLYKMLVESGSIDQDNVSWERFLESQRTPGTFAEGLILTMTPKFLGVDLWITAHNSTIVKDNTTGFGTQLPANKTLKDDKNAVIWIASFQQWHFQSIHPVIDDDNDNVVNKDGIVIGKRKTRSVSKKSKDHTKAKSNPKKTKENKERNHDPTNDNIPISPSHRNYKDLSDLHLSETDKNTILPLE